MMKASDSFGACLVGTVATLSGSWLASSRSWFDTFATSFICSFHILRAHTAKCISIVGDKLRPEKGEGMTY